MPQAPRLQVGLVALPLRFCNASMHVRTFVSKYSCIHVHKYIDTYACMYLKHDCVVT